MDALCACRTFESSCRVVGLTTGLSALLLLGATSSAWAAKADVSVLREQAWSALAARQTKLKALSDALWRYAEVGLEESRSSAALADYVESEGFAVRRGVAGIPTAFVATFGRGRPRVGILAEFDALPGLSNKAVPREKPREAGGAGHGCGHNIFGAASVGAAVAAKHVMQSRRLPGTIVLFGTPAEETLIGKVYMAKAGVFEGLDACLDWHPGDETGVDFSSSRAMNSFSVEFFGKTAHGAADPWNGRSALDAVELANHGVNMLREHLRPSIRIHYVISHGGNAPNVVPNYAKAWYYVRDLDRAGVEAAYGWMLDVAKGAAIATQTTHKVELLTGVHAYLLNRPFTELIDRNLKAAGAPSWSDEEQAFARTIQRETGTPEEGLFVGITPMPAEEEAAKGGSTDAAEVSRIAPTARFRVAAAPIDAPWHAWPVVACGGMSIGHKAMLTAARTLAGSALELLVSPQVIKAARREFEEKTGKKRYRSPIPRHQKPPLPAGSSG